MTNDNLQAAGIGFTLLVALISSISQFASPGDTLILYSILLLLLISYFVVSYPLTHYKKHLQEFKSLDHKIRNSPQG